MKLKCVLLYSAVLMCSAYTVKAATIGVAIRDPYYYTPTNIVIRPMDRVVWTNLGSRAHDVTSSSSPRLWTSPNLTVGATYGFTFTNVGYYPYFCLQHRIVGPRQTGTVTVVNISLASVTKTDTNTQFEVRGGRQGLRAVVEAGGALGTVTPIATNIFPASGTLRFTNNAPPVTSRFYRARVIP